MVTETTENTNNFIPEETSFVGETEQNFDSSQEQTILSPESEFIEAEVIDFDGDGDQNDYTGTETTESTSRGFSNTKVGTEVDSLASGIVTSLILTGLTWLSYKFLWNKDANDEQKQIMWRGIVVILACASGWRWFKALFP